jgi:hypothetical protein
LIFPAFRQELQKKGAANIGKVNNQAAANPLMRSKSVQQSRPGAGPNNNKLNDKLDRLNNNDKRSVSNVKNRPASMYEGSKPQANNARGGGGGKPTGGGGAGMNNDPKKAMKSAFGHAVMNEKLPPNKGHGGAGGAANKNPPPQNNKFGNQNNNNNFKNDLMPPKKMKEEMAINGFAKLQQKVQGQPLVVSYEEDENPMAGNKNRRGGGGGGRGEMEESLELRGQSHYIPVTDDDNSYNYPPQRNKNGKQVSDVLMNARKGKFA